MIEQPNGGFNYLTSLFFDAIHLKLPQLTFEAEHLVIYKSELSEAYLKPEEVLN